MIAATDLYEQIIDETEVDTILEREKTEDKKDIDFKNSVQGQLVPINGGESLESLVSLSPKAINLNLNNSVLDDKISEQISNLMTYMGLRSSFIRVYGFLSGLNDFVEEHKKEIDFNEYCLLGKKLLGEEISTAGREYVRFMSGNIPNRKFDVGDVVRVVDCSEEWKIGSDKYKPYMQNRNICFPISSIGSIIQIGIYNEIYIRFQNNSRDKWAKHENQEVNDWAGNFNKEGRKLVGRYEPPSLEYVPITVLHKEKFFKQIERLRQIIINNGK